MDRVSRSYYNYHSYQPFYIKGWRPKKLVTVAAAQAFLAGWRNPSDTTNPASKNPAPT